MAMWPSRSSNQLSTFFHVDMKAIAQQENKDQVTTSAADVAARSYVSPDVNIFETTHSYTLEAEMPGVTKDNLEVTLEGNCLTLVGRRSDEPLAGAILYQESRPADYRRVFELDPAIDTKRIRAQMHQGVLTLELPKAEAVKPRRISID